MTRREDWIAIFEAAATQKGDELNDQWRWLMSELRLSLDHYPAVREALRQGRWRTAKNPKAYLKTVAKREAARDQADTSPVVLVDGPQHGEFSMAGSLGDISYANNRLCRHVAMMESAVGTGVFEMDLFRSL